MSESIDVAVGVFEGKVVATWHDPVSSITFDAKNAYTVGLALSRAALDAYNGGRHDASMEAVVGELAANKVVITDIVRARLIQQVATIVKTFMQTGKTPGYIAMHCVDEVLKETAR